MDRPELWRPGGFFRAEFAAYWGRPVSERLAQLCLASLARTRCDIKIDVLQTAASQLEFDVVA